MACGQSSRRGIAGIKYWDPQFIGVSRMFLLRSMLHLRMNAAANATIRATRRRFVRGQAATSAKKSADQFAVSVPSSTRAWLT